MITNKIETKIVTRHVFFEITIWNSRQKWNNETFQYQGNKYFTCKKDYSLNLSTCICENDKYLKGIPDMSM